MARAETLTKGRFLLYKNCSGAVAVSSGVFHNHPQPGSVDALLSDPGVQRFKTILIVGDPEVLFCHRAGKINGFFGDVSADNLRNFHNFNF